MTNRDLKNLFGNWYEYSCAVCFPILQDNDLVEDAVQEAFMDIWRQAPKHFGPNYVRKIAQRRALDIKRRHYGRGKEQRAFVSLDSVKHTEKELCLENYTLLKASIEKLLGRMKARDAQVFLNYCRNGGGRVEAQRLADEYGLSAGRVW